MKRVAEALLVAALAPVAVAVATVIHLPFAARTTAGLLADAAFARFLPAAQETSR